MTYRPALDQGRPVVQYVSSDFWWKCRVVKTGLWCKTRTICNELFSWKRLQWLWFSSKPNISILFNYFELILCFSFLPFFFLPCILLRASCCSSNKVSPNCSQLHQLAKALHAVSTLRDWQQNPGISLPSLHESKVTFSSGITLLRLRKQRIKEVISLVLSVQTFNSLWGNH